MYCDGDLEGNFLEERYCGTSREMVSIVASEGVFYVECPSQRPSLPSWGVWSPQGSSTLFFFIFLDWELRADHTFFLPYSIVVLVY